MKHIVILKCEKCGKTVEFPGNVLRPSIARTSDPYWGYAPSEREAEKKHEADRKKFKEWDVRPEDRFELCPECKRKHWDFINQAKAEAERALWEEDTEE